MNISFTGVAPMPLDTRASVSTNAGLNNILVPYNGLLTYVEDEDKYYKYLNGSWGVYVIALDVKLIQSSTLGEPIGSIQVTNVVLISQVDYDQAVIDVTLVTGTHYIIT